MFKRIEIYLDLDGVVSNLDKSIYDKFGLNFPDEIIPEEDFNKIRDEIYRGISNDPDFWIEIEPFEGYYDFYRKLTASFSSIKILSAIPHHLSCFSPEAEMIRKQKIEWVRMHFGDEQSKNVIITKAIWKYKYISKNIKSILIDDTPSNIEKWNSSGGLGILHTSFEDSLDKIFNRDY